MSKLSCDMFKVNKPVISKLDKLPTAIVRYGVISATQLHFICINNDPLMGN